MMKFHKGDALVTIKDVECGRVKERDTKGIMEREKDTGEEVMQELRNLEEEQREILRKLFQKRCELYRKLEGIMLRQYGVIQRTLL